MTENLVIAAAEDGYGKKMTLLAAPAAQHRL